MLITNGIIHNCISLEARFRLLLDVDSVVDKSSVTCLRDTEKRRCSGWRRGVQTERGESNVYIINGEGSSVRFVGHWFLNGIESSVFAFSLTWALSDHRDIKAAEVRERERERKREREREKERERERDGERKTPSKTGRQTGIEIRAAIQEAGDYSQNCTHGR